MTHNPYQSPSEVDSDRKTFNGRTHEQLSTQSQPSRSEALAARAQILAWCYPLLALASLYGTWLIAWLVLGHMPRPSLDDPKSISSLVDVAHTVTTVLLIGFPVAAIAGIALQLVQPRVSWSTRVLCCGAMILLWLATIAFLRWDPFQVGTWYMD